MNTLQNHEEEFNEFLLTNIKEVVEGEINNIDKIKLNYDHILKVFLNKFANIII